MSADVMDLQYEWIEADAAMEMQPCLCSSGFRCTRCKGRDALAKMKDMLDVLMPADLIETRLTLAGTPKGYLSRIATSLERIVELMEATMEPDDLITPDVVVDADGKLMHCTAEYRSGGMLSAYVLAHDPEAALRACIGSLWGNDKNELMNMRADHDD